VKGRLTLGRFDVLPLVDARELARDALKSAARGHDPGLKKDRDREAPTFKQLADRYVEEYAKPRKRTWQKDQRLLEKNLIPGLGRHKAHMITRADLRAELNKVKNRPAPVEAHRTFEVVRRLFNWAIEEEILTENPAAKLAKPAEEIPRERTLTADELQILWRALDDAIPIVRSVFRLMMLGRAAAERGFADALARSRPVRGMVEHPGRVDQDEAALPGADHARDAGDHRGNGKARARSRMGFPSAAGGGPVPETNVTRPFRRLIKDAGIAHFMPHDLLHTRRPSLGPMQPNAVRTT
jgi:integrase